jgi:hypothetical protein
VVSAGFVVLSVVFLRPHIVVPILVIVVAYAVLTGALFFSRRGAREIVAESDEDRLKKFREKISRSASLRERISVLRLGDERMSRAVELSTEDRLGMSGEERLSIMKELEEKK